MAAVKSSAWRCLHVIDDIAARVAAVAEVDLLGRVDPERRRALLVERAATDPLLALLAQLGVGAVRARRCRRGRAPPRRRPASCGRSRARLGVRQQQLLEAAQREAVGHAGDVVGHARGDVGRPARRRPSRPGTRRSTRTGCARRTRRDRPRRAAAPARRRARTGTRAAPASPRRPARSGGCRRRHRRSRRGRARSRRCAPSPSRRAARPGRPGSSPASSTPARRASSMSWLM